MSRHRHWVIDMQGAQSASRHRGIGRYTESLVRNLLRKPGGRRITLLFNGSFPSSVNRWRELIAAEGWDVAVRVWHPPGAVSFCDPNNLARTRIAEELYQAVVTHLEPDGLLVTSLFEGFVDDAVISLTDLGHIAVGVVHYDLVPWVNKADYLDSNPSYAHFYQHRLTDLHEAGGLLAISDYSGREATKCLEIDPKKVTVISSDADPVFHEGAVPAELPGCLQDRGLTAGFILYVGGVDPRKNLECLLKAVGQLPAPLQEAHPLVCVGKLTAMEAKKLRAQAEELGVRSTRLVLLDDVEDDTLIALYGHCGVFVFPSRHEGFGLPPLEAMRCGAPVLAANSTSLPEVVANQEALFDPDDPSELEGLMQRVLTDQAFRDRLVARGQEASARFSWDATAERAWQALDAIAQGDDHQPLGEDRPLEVKPTLAFVSPLPPARTGIADYSAELLDALSAHYDLVLVTDQQAVDESIPRRFGPIRSTRWLRENADRSIDRVLYQVGNSTFHVEADDLLDVVPGVVTLHDFFLGGLFLRRPPRPEQGSPWHVAAFESHGYLPWAQAPTASDDELINEWPCSWPMIERALGIVVHSRHAIELADAWYRPATGEQWDVIPHLRVLPEKIARSSARRRLGIAEGEFLVCCFGLIGPSKRNLELIEAWAASRPHEDKAARLVFVGQNHGGEYGDEIQRRMARAGGAARIEITGWADRDQFQDYLQAADMAVQLRGDSRGETSGTVLDAMAHGLPVVVNAHGSMAELPTKAVAMLPDRFAPDELTTVIDRLYTETETRQELGHQAREWIVSHHDPARCAERYANAIESGYRRADRGIERLMHRLNRESATAELALEDRLQLAQALDRSFPVPPSKPRLLIDVTATATTDRYTGIERVARALARAYLQHPPAGYRVEPICLVFHGGQWVYQAAHEFAAQLLGIKTPPVTKAIVEPSEGDHVLVADLSGHSFIQAAEQGVFAQCRARGAKVAAIVFDLLPITLPDCFPPGADQGHREWLDRVVEFDATVAISQSVSMEVEKWVKANRPDRVDALANTWFHLGADIDGALPTKGLPAKFEAALESLRAAPTFLMVGTIEPRKRYAEVLDAFERLWAAGHDFNLVIVGSEGWRGLPRSDRRDIPETIERLRHHPERGARLHWFSGLSDEALGRLYEVADWLVAASADEGFGLPLIEAAHHGLPVLARDIPVFHEVAAPGTRFFGGPGSPSLDTTIVEASRYRPNAEDVRGARASLSWEESAQMLWSRIGPESSRNAH
jgi:glycosyltransferase involved in cell wall biosynthesis